jgi:lipopolysaccharide/colanic/teichoic acid biosynthesis glycosyltransferase
LATPLNLHVTETQALPIRADSAPARPRRERARLVRGGVRMRGYRWYARCKRALDFGAAALLAIPTAPLLAVIALFVKLTSHGPAFYSQTRVGKNGRLFTIYKLRTMIDNCESLTGPRWSMPGDPRVTRVGAFLRATHLDELPQLLNVLRGDMSLIGPRPERPEFVPELERALPAYGQRLLIRPGVTGLAQVQQPADTDLDCVRRKLAYDLYYIERLSPWLDLRLLFATAFYALGVPFRVVGRLARLPRPEQVERAMQSFLSEGAPPRQRRSA